MVTTGAVLAAVSVSVVVLVAGSVTVIVLTAGSDTAVVFFLTAFELRAAEAATNGCENNMVNIKTIKIKRETLREANTFRQPPRINKITTRQQRVVLT